MDLTGPEGLEGSGEEGRGLDGSGKDGTGVDWRGGAGADWRGEDRRGAEGIGQEWRGWMGLERTGVDRMGVEGTGREWRDRRGRDWTGLDRTGPDGREWLGADRNGQDGTGREWMGAERIGEARLPRSSRYAKLGAGSNGDPDRSPGETRIARLGARERRVQRGGFGPEKSNQTSPSARVGIWKIQAHYLPAAKTGSYLQTTLGRFLSRRSTTRAANASGFSALTNVLCRLANPFRKGWTGPDEGVDRTGKAGLEWRGKVLDPIRLGNTLWPGIELYKEQREICYSVLENNETYVPSANMMGKDFTAAYLVLTIFLSCIKLGVGCRIITTSVKGEHLGVLWAEIGRLVMGSKYPLVADRGGPLILMHQEIRRADERESKNPANYLKAMVSETGEGLSGHHAEFTLLVGDESSAIPDLVYSAGQGWAKRFFFFGNPNDCQNFFRKAIEAGDLKRENGDGYIRKIIKLNAEKSPSVKLALKQLAIGKTPTNEILVPGVIRWENGVLGYQYRRKHWDARRQCVGLDAEFYKGVEVLLFPPEWLSRAGQLADEMNGRKRQARAIGIDPAEGGDKTAMAAVDEYGLLELVSRQTPDTSVVTGEALAFMFAHGVPAEKVLFDRGGGGKEHADRLRSQGYNVGTLAFGETVSADPKRRGTVTSLEERIGLYEESYAYRNRRAELYGNLSRRLNPTNALKFAIPREYTELLWQLGKFPRWYDSEGRITLPPKSKRGESDTRKTLTELIGHSPDEADALVLALYAMEHKTSQSLASAF